MTQTSFPHTTDPVPSVGLLYPGHAAEDDYPSFEKAAEGAIRLPLVHSTIGVDEHTVEALLETGSHHRLAEAAQRLLEQETTAGRAVDSLMWACTSGSFVYGWEGAHDQAAALQDAAGIPTSSTSLAFARAAQHLGVGTVAVAASYPEDLAHHFRTFMAAAGAEVVAFQAHGVFTAAEVGLMDKDRVIEMIRGVDTADAEAMLVPDTAMHSLLRVEEMEAALGKPVLTANQVTVWEGLRISGKPAPALPPLGALFSSIPV